MVVCVKEQQQQRTPVSVFVENLRPTGYSFL